MRSIIIALARIIAGRRSASTVSVTHNGRTVPGTDDYGFSLVLKILLLFSAIQLA